VAESTAKLVMQLQAPFEQYDSGYRKGEYKLGVKLGKLVPIYKQLSSLTPDGINERSLWLN